MQFKLLSSLLAPSSILILVLSLCGQATAQTIVPPAQDINGSIDVGLLHDSLSSGYPNWNGEFVRGILRSDADNVWNAEIVNAREFGDGGALAVLGNTHDFNDRWYSNLSASTSSGGFFFPHLRVDAAINYKWLERRDLVTTLSVTAVNSKDGHKDRSLLLAASYYFSTPWIIEGGIRINHSDPGQVVSNAKYLAVTYGEDKKQIMSLRYGFGAEAYQYIGQDALLVNFDSDVWTWTWRKWVRPRQGFQIRAEAYHNPYYDRHGIEFSLFQEF